MADARHAAHSNPVLAWPARHSWPAAIARPDPEAPVAARRAGNGAGIGEPRTPSFPRSPPAISPNTSACSPPTLSKAARPVAPGEDKTVDYIVAVPAHGPEAGQQRQLDQTVPMTETTATKRPSLTIDVKGKPHALKFGDDMVIGTRSGRSTCA
jgi:hypothetical protein